MYVKRVFYDNYDGIFNEEESLYNPTWKEIESIIDSLDGRAITQIIIDGGDEDNYLCIGGGNDELCNVYISEDDNQKITNLVNKDYKDGVIHQLVTGGQMGEFSDKTCVSISIAKKVAKKYCDMGTKDDAYEWE